VILDTPIVTVSVCPPQFSWSGLGQDRQSTTVLVEEVEELRLGDDECCVGGP